MTRALFQSVHGLFAVACALYGGNLKLLKEYTLDLNPPVSQQTVIGLSFSPIEERIAVCVKAADGRHLIVLDRDKRTMLEMPSALGYRSCSERLYWSRDGQILVTQSSNGVRALSIHTAKDCLVPSRYAADYLVILGFINNDHFIVAGGYNPGVLQGVFRSTRISVIDRNCTETAFWIVPDRVYDGATSPFSGLVVLRRKIAGNLYLDTKTGVQTERATRDFPAFADFGQILCLGGRSHIACHDISLAGAHKFGPRAIRVFTTATQSPRLAVLELNSSRSPFSESTHVSLKRWIIWDIRKEETVATLEAIAQKGDPQPEWLPGNPFASDLAPSGSRFAVAGDDRLIVYEIVSQKR